MITLPELTCSPDLVIGIDPGSAYTGVSVVAVPAVGLRQPPPLLALARLRTANRRKAWEALRRVARWARHGGGMVIWAIEAAPAKLKKGQHGSHLSGAGPAWWRSAATTVAWDQEQEAEEIEISPWRRTARQLDTRWSDAFPRPSKRPAPATPGRRAPHEWVDRIDKLPEQGMVLVLYGCGHKRRMMRAAFLSQPPACIECTGRPRERDAGDEHKRWAVRWVGAHWPAQLDRIVGEARSSARAKAKPEHELAGVPDACESVGVACHLVHDIVQERALVGMGVQEPSRRTR